MTKKILSTEQEPDIFKFTDFREFLRSSFEMSKVRNRYWTLGAWAKKMGLGSTGVLSNVLSGTRHPGHSIQRRLITYYGFNEREAIHFLGLVQLSKMEEATPGLSRVPEEGHETNEDIKLESAEEHRTAV